MGGHSFSKNGPGVSPGPGTTKGHFRMDYAIFLIDYLDGKGRGVHSKTIMARDDMDACDYGWDNMPEGATDFQVEECVSGAWSGVGPLSLAPLLLAEVA